MANKTIAIIGATGRIGAILTTHLAKGKYTLLLFSHDMQELKGMVREIKKTSPAADLHSYRCLVDAGWEADIIVFAVSLHALDDLADRLSQVATQKIVINMSGDLNRMLTNAGEERDMNDTESLAKLLPHSKIVNVYLANESEYPGSPIHVIISGTNMEAVATMEEIFILSGFDVAIHAAADDV